MRPHSPPTPAPSCPTPQLRRESSEYLLVVIVYGVSVGSLVLHWFFIKGCSSGYQSQRLVVQLQSPPDVAELSGAMLPRLLSRHFSCTQLLQTAPPSTVY